MEGRTGAKCYMKGNNWFWGKLVFTIWTNRFLSWRQFAAETFHDSLCVEAKKEQRVKSKVCFYSVHHGASQTGFREQWTVVLCYGVWTISKLNIVCFISIKLWSSIIINLSPQRIPVGFIHCYIPGRHKKGEITGLIQTVLQPVYEAAEGISDEEHVKLTCHRKRLMMQLLVIY